MRHGNAERLSGLRFIRLEFRRQQLQPIRSEFDINEWHTVRAT